MLSSGSLKPRTFVFWAAICIQHADTNVVRVGDIEGLAMRTKVGC